MGTALSLLFQLPSPSHPPHVHLGLQAQTTNFKFPMYSSSSVILLTPCSDFYSPPFWVC